MARGPQVDPGFSGYLSCPLYNLTDTDIIIERGDDFATIDFEKTTTLLPALSIEQRKEIIGKARNKQLQSVGNETWTFYTAGSLDPLGWRKSHKIISSLIQMDKELRTWRNLGIGSVIAFFTLTLSLLAFGTNLYRQYSETYRQVMENTASLNEAKSKFERIERSIEQFSTASKQGAPAEVVVESGKPKKAPR